MEDTLRIGQTEVAPGERVTIDLPIARLYTHTEMTMPVHVVRGRRPGPCLFVTGAIHGDEIVWTEIVRRLLKLKLTRQIRGTFIAIPIVNVYGFVNHSRYLPDRRDLNRSFPGSDKGSLASQLARLLMDEIACHCTHGIDLHAGSNHRNNLPQIRACLDDPETARLARNFGAPIVIDSRLRDGSLREAVREKGIPVLLYEGGEALRFSELAIGVGLRVIVAIMRDIGLLPARRLGRTPPEPLVARANSWVRAPVSGILPRMAELGTRVAAGDVLATIADPFGEVEEEVHSTVSGVVIGRLNLPMVHRGDALFNIAHLDAAKAEPGALEVLDTYLTPEGGVSEEERL